MNRFVLAHRGRLTGSIAVNPSLAAAFASSAASLWWSNGIAALLEYINREGHSLVPARHVEAGFNLGTWVRNRRREYADGRLLDGVKSALELVDLWIWDTSSDPWAVNLEQLDRFVAVQGHARVPGGYISDAVHLGSWVNGKRHEYSSGELPPERALALESRTGWVWSVTEAHWEEGLSCLDSFFEANGHLLVPAKHIEGAFHLGSWVNGVRGSIKSGTISGSRLNDIVSRPQWVLDVPTHKWNQALAHLDAFIDREGHSRVKVDHLEEGFALGNWVRKRRDEYKRGKCPAYKVTDLQSRHLWTWDPYSDDFAVLLRKIDEFVLEFGHARVPASYKADGVNVGQRVSGLRSKYKIGKVPATTVAELESRPGWVWSAR